MRIQGSKGGSSGSTPTESPDSLHSIAYAKVLDVISEGPIAGLANGLQSVFLDGTPIQNSDGSTNFSNYSVDTRTGTPDQTYMSGFPSVENETAVSTPLTSDAPWVHQVQNTQLTAVRIRFGVPALQKSDASSGNVTGYRIEYAIDLAVDGGSYAQVLSGAFNGKTTSLYERTVRIDLPTATTSWLVRVRRITPNAHSSLIADTVNIEAITEIIDRKLRYPMSALVGLSFDARSFSSVPTRSYDINGLMIRVPTNYDPVARTYSGTWDGTFKTAWSNNPAWVFYDLVLNARYGLGNRVDASMVDKWGLYAIAQYCDVMVSDGKGGQEPRFTCNCVIQSQADAYKVLQDLATTFRGIAYWGPGSVVASSDMPADPVYIYTDANRCVSGPFTYVGSALKTRYTTALVSWNDPANQYKQTVEYVPDEDGIARYGVTKAQITAFGTTSQGQAHRLGLWTLLTSRYETNTVSFSVGLDATLCAPGQIIAVADPSKAGKRIGGRIRSVSGRNVTLDKAPATAAGDTFTAILPGGVAQARTVSSISGDTITINSPFDADPVPGAVWMLESTDLAAQLFRVVSVQEASDNDKTTYVINATQHEPGKYAAIDNGAQIQVRPITIIPPSVQPPPANVRVSTYSVIDQGISKTVMVIAWDAAASAVNYVPEWRKDNGEWVTANQTGGLQVEVVGIYQGTYLARVRAQNAMGVTSIPAYGTDTSLTGKTSPPPALASLTTTTQVFAIQLDWTFPADGSAGDTQRTEIWYSETNDRSTAVKLADYSYPQARANLMGLAAGRSFFFWGRLVDTTGNIGPWYPTGAGVNGQSSSDASEILSYLSGQITQTQLGQDVLAPIQAIPGIQQGVANNTAAIAQESTDRAAAISSEATARANAITAEQQARADAIAAEALARGTAITTEQNTRASADSALSTRIDTVTAANGSNASAITAEATARADADSALGTRIDAVVATANGNTSAITSEATTRANADSAMASDIALIGAHNAAKSAFILNQSTVQVDASTTLAQKFSALTTADGNNSTAITNEATARTTADTALGTRIDNLTTTVNSNSAAITAEQTARANGDSANASAITALTSTVGTKNTTFRQSVTPIAQAVGDTWVDTGSANLFLQSQAFDNAAWSKARIASTTVNSVAAPDGTTTAETITSDATGTSYEYQSVAVTVGTVYTMSVYAKAGSGSVFDMHSFTQSGGCTFTLSGSGTAGTPSGVFSSPAIVPVGNGWYRCSIRYTASATGSNNIAPVYITPANTSLNFWGAQFEQASGPGRYIPTTTASVSTVGNNNLLVWDGTTWVLSQDAAIPANTAAINSEATTRATADSALSTRIDSISAQIVIPEMAGSTGDYAGSTTVYAGVWSEQSARAEADLAQAQKTETVTAQMTSANVALSAAVQTETTARIAADSAQASQITTVQAQADANTAAVQTVATSYADLNGRVAASYQIKTQITANGRTYIAGIGVGVDNSSGTVESQVLVSASRFAVLDPNGSAVSSPFVVQGGQVFISQAFIGTGWIQNAMIGDVIQSTAVGANGQPRWRLDKNGTLTMNGANGGSGYLTLSDSTLQVYDNNGTLRVRVGLW